jgi:hypothetical protein
MWQYVFPERGPKCCFFTHIQHQGNARQYVESWAERMGRFIVDNGLAPGLHVRLDQAALLLSLAKGYDEPSRQELHTGGCDGGVHVPGSANINRSSSCNTQTSHTDFSGKEEDAGLGFIMPFSPDGVWVYVAAMSHHYVRAAATAAALVDEAKRMLKAAETEYLNTKNARTEAYARMRTDAEAVGDRIGMIATLVLVWPGVGLDGASDVWICTSDSG